MKLPITGYIFYVKLTYRRNLSGECQRLSLEIHIQLGSVRMGERPNYELTDLVARIIFLVKYLKN